MRSCPGTPIEPNSWPRLRLEIGTESGQPDAFGFYGAEMIGVRRQQGRYGELDPDDRAGGGREPGPPGVPCDAGRRTYGSRQRRHGSPDARSCGPRTSTSLPYDVVWIFAVASYADVATELHAEGPARLLLDLLVPFDDQLLFIGATAGSPVAYYCGSLESVLGRYNEAEEALRSSSRDQCQRSVGVRCRSHSTCSGAGCSRPAEPQEISNEPRDLLAPQPTKAALSRGYASIALASYHGIVGVILGSRVWHSQKERVGVISVTDCPSHLQEPRSRRRLKAISASRYNENLRADSGDSESARHEAEPYVVGAEKSCPHTCEIANNADQ